MFIFNKSLKIVLGPSPVMNAQCIRPIGNSPFVFLVKWYKLDTSEVFFLQIEVSFSKADNG